MSAPEGFAELVATRSAALVRSAWLLTGDEAAAQDLVQTALAATWVRWGRLREPAAAEAYVRRVMLTTFLSWRRRRWHREVATGTLPETPVATDVFAQADLRASVAAALARLPRRQRAVIVLRYVEDLTEVQAAQELGCAVGTVKSQAAKALATLRASPELAAVWGSEVSHDRH